VAKKKNATPEELEMEEFMKLEEAPEGVRRRKVDYDAVIGAILGRALSVRKIASIMMDNAVGKADVYYSEVTGFLTRLSKKAGFKVEKRAGEVVYYRVTKTGIPKASKKTTGKKTP